jgi:hypothetical protein
MDEQTRFRELFVGETPTVRTVEPLRADRAADRQVGSVHIEWEGEEGTFQGGHTGGAAQDDEAFRDRMAKVARSGPTVGWASRMRRREPFIFDTR